MLAERVGLMWVVLVDDAWPRGPSQYRFPTYLKAFMWAQGVSYPKIIIKEDEMLMSPRTMMEQKYYDTSS